VEVIVQFRTGLSFDLRYTQYTLLVYFLTWAEVVEWFLEVLGDEFVYVGLYEDNWAVVCFTRWCRNLTRKLCVVLCNLEYTLIHDWHMSFRYPMDEIIHPLFWNFVLDSSCSNNSSCDRSLRSSRVGMVWSVIVKRDQFIYSSSTIRSQLGCFSVTTVIIGNSVSSAYLRWTLIYHQNASSICFKLNISSYRYIVA